MDDHAGRRVANWAECPGRPCTEAQSFQCCKKTALLNFRAAPSESCVGPYLVAIFGWGSSPSCIMKLMLSK
jgi:hypothetical protein